MSKIKYFIQQSWLLIVTSFFFGLLIAVANAAWLPKIEQNKKDKLNNLMRGLVSKAATFEVALADLQIPQKGKAATTDVYKAIDPNGQAAGFVFIAEGGGFADKIELVIAVDANCEKFLGFKVLWCNETPGFGDRIKGAYFGEQFKGAPTKNFKLIKTGKPEDIDDEIVAISGATVSSTAVVNIFNTYIDKVKDQLQKKGIISNGK